MAALYFVVGAFAWAMFLHSLRDLWRCKRASKIEPIGMQMIHAALDRAMVEEDCLTGKCFYIKHPLSTPSIVFMAVSRRLDGKYTGE